MVKLKATELDVYVNGVRVGWVTDGGDCWRIGILGRRKRRAYNLDFDTRKQAVDALVKAVQ
jgi:hypothetical protein